MPKYKTYHGRSRFHGLKVTLLTILLAALAAFFIFVVPNYIAYDADGNISLDLPFLSGILRPPAPTVEPSPTGVQLVIESPPPHGPGSTDDTDGPSPTPERPPQFAGAQLFIPAARLNVPDMTDLRDKAAAEDFSGVIIEYKREGTGGSGGDSNLTMAPETAETVMEVFAGSGLELTALISVGVDNEKPRTAEFTAFAVKHVSGQNFMDRNGNRWLDMYRAEVHTLAIDLSREALAAGFDRVLLSNVGFPHGGGTDRVLYGAAAGRTPTEAVNEFLARMRQELADAPLDAILFPETARDGREETAGQDAASFKDAFDRLLVFDGEDPAPAGFIPILQRNDPGLDAKIAAARNGHLLFSPNGVY